MKHTKGNWKVGRGGVVVTDDLHDVSTAKESGHDDTKYYGGFLVCESIRTIDDAKLIALAPEMLEILETIENEDGNIPSWLWMQIKNLIKKTK